MNLTVLDDKRTDYSFKSGRRKSKIDYYLYRHHSPEKCKLIRTKTEHKALSTSWTCWLKQEFKCFRIPKRDWIPTPVTIGNNLRETYRTKLSEYRKQLGFKYRVSNPFIPKKINKDKLTYPKGLFKEGMGVNTGIDAKEWQDYLLALYDRSSNWDRKKLVLKTDVEKKYLCQIDIWNKLELTVKNFKSKAAGPDGINIMHVRADWNWWKTFTYKVFEEAGNSGLLPGFLNKAYLIPIKKSPEASEPKDFRTVALNNVVVKLLCKVILLVLNNRQEACIDEAQYGFRSKRACNLQRGYVIQLNKVLLL